MKLEEESVRCLLSQKNFGTKFSTKMFQLWSVKSVKAVNCAFFSQCLEPRLSWIRLGLQQQCLWKGVGFVCEMMDHGSTVLHTSRDSQR